ncbi:MAG: class I SAM-dependent methyltransferase [Chloroflexi bacterium]|nr:class I SAM-dependent methyltransferase [Chloroflexota bacterium]
MAKENLQKQANFSETIEHPSIFGTFNSEQHYFKTLSLVLSSTHETRNRIEFCLNKILPLIPEGGSLLDIGPGDGALTKTLAHHFKHITAVDTNHHALTHLKEVLHPSIDSMQISGSISNIDLKSEHYNLAILSHILYYIEPHLWIGIIKSVYSSLKENGLLVIVLGGDELGKSELIQHFGGEILSINSLATQCRDIFGESHVNFYVSDESFVTCTQKGMLHISGFMLADANISASEDDLNRYIAQKLRHSDSYFEMTTRQKYIIIKKTVCNL